MVPGSLGSGDELSFTAALRAWVRAGLRVLLRFRRAASSVAGGLCLAAALLPAPVIWS